MWEGVICRDNYLLNWYINIHCSCTEYTKELEELKVARCRITTTTLLLPTPTHTHTHISKSHLCYDRRSVGQSVLVSSIHLGLTTRFLLLSDSCGVVDVGLSLWRENGSAVYNCCCTSLVHSFLVPSPAGIVIIFYCLWFETPPTWRARFPYLHPPERGWPSYTPRHWVKVKVMLRPTVQSVSLSWNKAPIWGLRPEFYSVRVFQACWCGAFSLTRRRVCRLPGSVSSNTSLVSIHNLHVTSY
jgi:hypothetical protein